MKTLLSLASMLSLALSLALGGAAMAQDVPINCADLSKVQIEKGSVGLTSHQLQTLADLCERQAQELKSKSDVEPNRQDRIALRSRAFSALLASVAFQSAAVDKKSRGE